MGGLLYRGGYEYHWPYGWKRYAIKVLGRFENDNWLGEKGLWFDSSEGEWPVSYHGTGECKWKHCPGWVRLSKGKQCMGEGFTPHHPSKMQQCMHKCSNTRERSTSLCFRIEFVLPIWKSWMHRQQESGNIGCSPTLSSFGPMVYVYKS